MLKFGSALRIFARGKCVSIPPSTFKVSVIGAAGGIGQPLSLLLKKSTMVSHLALYDIARVKGVAMDLSHIETPALVRGYQGDTELRECLKDADIVVVPAGIPRKPGMTRDDLFNTNASIVADLAYKVADHCPEAIMCIITNPVNSTVPIAAEILKKKGCFDRRKLFGVTTLDVVRSNAFISQAKAMDVQKISCPVIGGHSGITILPVFSQCQPGISFPLEEREALTKRIQNAGTEVVEAKEGGGSATLSMAYAGARFCGSLMEALSGRGSVVECAYVATEDHEVDYFALPVSLGKHGIEECMKIAKMNEFENAQMKLVIKQLKLDIDKGVAFARSY